MFLAVALVFPSGLLFTEGSAFGQETTDTNPSSGVPTSDDSSAGDAPVSGSPTPEDSIAEPAIQASTSAEEPAKIRELMLQLSSPSYRARQIARWRLEQTPLDTMRDIPGVIRTLDHNAASQLIDLISALAMHADAHVSLKARQLLELLADEVTAIGHLANNTLAAIADLQEAQAIDELSYCGAYVGQQDFAVNGRAGVAEPYLALRIGENFRGTDETIQRIRFLKSVRAVYLSGPIIDSRFYEAIGSLSKIKIIKLKHVRIASEDLRHFASLESLEHLDLNYLELDDAAVPEILELPITQSLRMFGTKVTEAGESKLLEQLDGIEIYRGNGGFLGVSTPMTSTIVTTVTPGSAADIAGIEMDDRLTHVDDVLIRTFDDLRHELGKHAAGEEISIRVKRGGFDLELPVELREDPN